MSRWESMPFDILVSELPYLDLMNPENVSKLCADPYISVRLQCDDPNGFLWKYVYTHEFSHILPSDLTQSLKERYYDYFNMKKHYDLESLLQVASQEGYEILVHKLVDKGADINENDSAPLSIAASRGRLDLVKFFIDRGADVNSGDILDSAVVSGDLNVVKYLLAHGANMDNSALVTAANENYPDIVAFLLDRGADVHYINDQALRDAAKHGYLNIVKMLVNHGANITANRNEALRNAVKNNHLDVAKYLASIAFNLH